MTLYSLEIKRELAKIEADLEKNWNHKGEPWCIVDPADGRIVDEGLGKICLRLTGNEPLTVTDWFDGLSPDELDRIFVKPYIKYEEFEEIAEGNDKLEKIRQIWIRNTAAGARGLVQLETDIENGHNLDGMIVTHYHPHGGTPTKKDVKSFQENNVLEMRAFGKGLLYILRRQ